jgi:fucose permease
MAFQAAETHADTDVGPFHRQYRLFHAAFAQFCYTGAQVKTIFSFPTSKLTLIRLPLPATSSIMSQKLVQTQAQPLEQSFSPVHRVLSPWGVSPESDS